MTTETGGPAFPAFEFHKDYGQMMPTRGMTVRDYFAAKAMKGLIANGNTDAQQMAKAAYIMADAMLKARTT